MKDGFVSNYIFTSSIDNLLNCFSLLETVECLHIIYRIPSFSTRVFVCLFLLSSNLFLLFLSQMFLLVVFVVGATAVFLFSNVAINLLRCKTNREFFFMITANKVGCYIKFTQYFGINFHVNFLLGCCKMYRKLDTLT